MSRFSDAKRSGYVTLLAVSFAFGLATLGTALAVSARSYLSSATSRERAILDRISLESVAAQTLAEVAVGGERPLTPTKLESVRINERSISRELSIPDGKVDPAMDDEAIINEVAPIATKSGRVGMLAWSGLLELTGAEEDCLRRRLTFGRAPEPLAVDHETAGASAALHVGDQLDIRLGLSGAARDRVLWIRARLSGSQGQWRIHDYRNLSGRFTTGCV